MSNEITTQDAQKSLAKVILDGDLSKLSPIDKVAYYKNVCVSVGLNPLTQPFKFIKFRDGKEQLYAGKDCTEQLRKLHGVSIKIVAREKIDDVYIVTAQATTKDGRIDESTGARTVKGKFGDSLANDYMAAETKAKRRVTLSICGLGFLDESEIESISGATPLNVDLETGEVLNAPKMPDSVKPEASDKVKEIISVLSMFYVEDDKLGVCDFWARLDTSTKETVKGFMPTDVKNWLRNAVTKGPKQAPAPVDYMGV